MAQGILLDKSKLLEVRVEGDHYHVVYGFHRFACFHKDDAMAKRVTATQLMGMGVAKTEIARAFGVQRGSIYLWGKDVQRRGHEGAGVFVEGTEGEGVRGSEGLYLCSSQESWG